jgi:hypothetical protein
MPGAYKNGPHCTAENDWIADLGSFYSEKPSKLFIEAIESSTILQIEKKDLLFLFVNVPKFDRNFKRQQLLQSWFRPIFVTSCPTETFGSPVVI